MSVFKDHQVSVNQLLNIIPESLLTHLSLTIKVDHYSKVLHGKKLFYLLLYGIIDNEKPNQQKNFGLLQIILNYQLKRLHRHTEDDGISKYSSVL